MNFLALFFASLLPVIPSLPATSSPSLQIQSGATVQIALEARVDAKSVDPLIASIMTKRSKLMIHEPSVEIDHYEAQPSGWQNIADDLRLDSEAMMEQYAHRMKLTVPELLQKVAGGRCWFMGWREALKLKAVDFVVDSYNDVLKKK